MLVYVIYSEDKMCDLKMHLCMEHQVETCWGEKHDCSEHMCANVYAASFRISAA